MEKVVLGILILICAVICWQDMRQRAVHWIMFPLLFVAAVGLKWESHSMESWMYNSFLLVFLMGALTLYLTFKNGKLINITKGFFSWGDILFLVAVIPLFKTASYLVFFTLGTIMVLLFHVLAHLIKPQTTIPYAGYMGIVTVLYLFLEPGIVNYLAAN